MIKYKKKASLYVVTIVALATIAVYYYIFYQPRISEQTLQQFHTLTQEDPLFYDPAMDVEFLRESVKEMSHADDLILYVDSLYRPSGPEEERGVFPEGWRLWPDEFLGVLPDIHEVTTEFLASPSAENAVALVALYEQATAYYKKAIDLHIKALENVFERDPKKRTAIIAFLGSGTTPEIVYNDFLLIRENAEALKKEIESRKKCLYRGQCEVSKSEIQDSKLTDQSEVVPYDPLPPEILGLEGELGKDYFGPYWAETGCFGFSEGGHLLQHSFFIKGNKRFDLQFYSSLIPDPIQYHPEPVLVPTLTNTKFYRDYTKTPDRPTAAFYLDRGIQFRAHAETTNYLCTDLTYIPHLLIQYFNRDNETNSSLTKNAFLTLPYLIQNTLGVSTHLLHFPLYLKEPRQALDTLVNRSAYSLYFGAFSPAVWRIREKTDFLLRKNFTEFLDAYSSIEELQKRGVSYQELVTSNRIPSIGAAFRGEMRNMPR
jgi:hypothetical protein